jgi:hypothetical protein
MRYRITAKKDDKVAFEMTVLKEDLQSVINAALNNKFELNIVPFNLFESLDLGEDEDE